jgi:hypothetical protein
MEKKSMRSKRLWLALRLVPVFTLWPPFIASGADTTIKTEELLTHHLEAIGSSEARAAAKSRVVQGTAVYRIVVGGGGRAEGKTGFVSEGHKLRWMAKLPSGDYRGENIVFNGKAVGVSALNAGQSRTAFATFIAAQDVIVRDGLLGGTLSTAWALLDLQGRNGKLNIEGLRKVDGRQLYQVRYEPARHTDAQITLYFEPDTFRHVKTVYATSVGNNVGGDITRSSKLQPERTTLEERFSDFKTVDGLTLPSHWSLQFTWELPNGTTSVTEWDLREDEITNNMGLDPRNFEVK